jgi:hypothetical protein
MRDSKLTTFLRSYKNITPNPFLNKNFFITAIETNKNLEEYLIKNVKIIFKNLECTILTDTEYIIAAYLALSIEDNAFGFDPKSKFYSDNYEVMYDKNLDIVEKFKYIESHIKNQKFQIIYSNTENGIDAFNYNRSLL